MLEVFIATYLSLGLTEPTDSLVPLNYTVSSASSVIYLEMFLNADYD